MYQRTLQRVNSELMARVFEWAKSELMETESFQLSACNHDFQHGDCCLEVGLALGLVPNKLEVSCTQCGENLEFRRISNQRWELGEDSRTRSKLSCAALRAEKIAVINSQKIAFENRWARMVASYSQN